MLAKSLALEADLSAYPIIRLDQVPLLDDATLRKAQADAFDLSNTLRTEDPCSKLLFFLQKQLDAMRSEEGKRAAQSRVQNLLAGIEDALSSSNELVKHSEELISIPAYLTPRLAVSSEDHTFRQSASAPPTSIAEGSVSDAYVPIRNRSTKKTISTENLKKYPEAELSVALSYNDDLNSQDSKVSVTSFEVAGASESHMGGQKLDAFDSVVKRDKKIQENDFIIKQQRQRKVLIENFGNQFVVESTHKKIRFFPTKKSQQLSPAEVLVRERDKRCNTTRITVS